MCSARDKGRRRTMRKAIHAVHSPGANDNKVTLRSGRACADDNARITILDNGRRRHTEFEQLRSSACSAAARSLEQLGTILLIPCECKVDRGDDTEHDDRVILGRERREASQRKTCRLRAIKRE